MSSSWADFLLRTSFDDSDGDEEFDPEESVSLSALAAAPAVPRLLSDAPVAYTDFLKSLASPAEPDPPMQHEPPSVPGSPLKRRRLPRFSTRPSSTSPLTLLTAAINASSSDLFGSAVQLARRQASLLHMLSDLIGELEGDSTEVTEAKAEVAALCERFDRWVASATVVQPQYQTMVHEYRRAGQPIPPEAQQPVMTEPADDRGASPLRFSTTDDALLFLGTTMCGPYRWKQVQRWHLPHKSTNALAQRFDKLPSTVTHFWLTPLSDSEMTALADGMTRYGANNFVDIAANVLPWRDPRALRILYAEAKQVRDTAAAADDDEADDSDFEPSS